MARRRTGLYLFVIFVAAGACGAVLWVVFALERGTRVASPTGRSRSEETGLIFPPLAGTGEPDAPASSDEVAVRRELPIEIWVVDSNGVPIAPEFVTVGIGPVDAEREFAIVDRSGAELPAVGAASGARVLRFPPKVRRRWSDVHVAVALPGSEPKQATFPAALTGDFDAAPRSPGSPSAGSRGTEGAAPDAAPVVSGDRPDPGSVDAVESPDPESDPELVPLGVPAAPRRIRWTVVLPDPSWTPPESSFWIAIDWVFAEDWAGGARVRASGRSSLPDGAGLDTLVTFDRYRTASSFGPAIVTRGAWRGTASVAEGTRLFSGLHEISGSFHPKLQDIATLEAWPDTSLLALDELEGSELVGTRTIAVGDPDEARAEDTAIQSYYRALLVRTQIYENALRTRLREIDAIAQGWDPAFLAANRRAHEAPFRETWIERDGSFDEARWRTFLDVEWRPEVLRDFQQHNERPLSKYREAEERGHGLLAALIDLSRLESMARIYPRFGLRTHPNDEFIAGGDALGDLALVESRIKDDRLKLARFCELVPDEPVPEGPDPEGTNPEGTNPEGTNPEGTAPKRDR
jgi:hypothetical protein